MDTDNSKKKLIVLTGPTAVGKTDLSIRLAKEVGGEIISADSMQVYRRMNIGTAKIRPEEMDGVWHHIIDILDPEENINAFLFKEYAKKAADEIWERNNIPIIVGGTGFYIQTLLYDIEFAQNDENDGIRDELNRLYEEKGAGYMHELLREIAPDYAAEGEENNVKKVIRAI